MVIPYKLQKALGRNPIKITFEKQQLLDIIRQRYEEKEYEIKYIREYPHQEYFEITRSEVSNIKLHLHLLNGKRLHGGKDRTLVIPSIKVKREPLPRLLEFAFMAGGGFVSLMALYYIFSLSNSLLLSYLSGIMYFLAASTTMLISIVTIIVSLVVTHRLAEDLPGKPDTNSTERELHEFEIFIKQKEQELGK